MLGLRARSLTTTAAVAALEIARALTGNGATPAMAQDKVAAADECSTKASGAESIQCRVDGMRAETAAAKAHTEQLRKEAEAARARGAAADARGAAADARGANARKEAAAADDDVRCKDDIMTAIAEKRKTALDLKKALGGKTVSEFGGSCAVKTAMGLNS